MTSRHYFFNNRLKARSSPEKPGFWKKPGFWALPLAFKRDVVFLQRSAAVRVKSLPPVRSFFLDFAIQLFQLLLHGVEPFGLLRSEVRFLLWIDLQVVEFEVSEVL